MSPEANDAYLAGNATLNDGLLLDGTGDHADIPYSPSLDPGDGDFTISLRFRYQATATTPNQALFWAYGVGADVPQVWLRAQPGSDQLLAWVQGKSAGVSVAAKDPVPSRVAFGDDAWHQVTLKRAGAKVDLTVDGVTHSESGVVGVVSEGTSGLRIGGKQDATGTDGFKGRIRDFQLTKGVTVVKLPFQAIDRAVVPARTVYPVAEDVSGHCAAATVLGGIQLGAGRSPDSSALQVSSAHPGVEAPFGPALDLGAGDFTFALWFRYQASGSSPNQALVWAYGTTSGKRSLWVRAQPSQDRVFAWVETANGPVSVPLVDSSGSRVAFGDNAWHLLTLTRSGSSVRLGVDGSFASQGGLSGSVSGDQGDGIRGLRLGSKLDGTDVLTGSLDDFRLYRRALSTAEVTTAAGGTFPGENPGLWWTFNNQSTQAHSIVDPVLGAQTPDSSVHCVQAAVSGAPAVVGGKVGGAVQFDGVDDSVRVPYRPSLALGDGDFTVSTWVKYTAGSADQVIFWGYGTGATERSVWLRAQPSKDRLYGYVQTDTGAYEFSGVDTSAAVAFGDGAWHHVALRRAGGSLGLFVDGNQVGSGPVSGSLTYGDTFAVDGFTLGVKPDGTDRFKGAMDLFEIQRRALADSELREVDGDFGSVTAVRLGLDSAS